MKKIIKKSYLLAAVLLATIVSCNSDDDTSATPINIENLEVTIDENPTNGQVIGTVQSNSNDALTYTIITQTPAGALSINATTGELLVADAVLFDFETNPTITAEVSSVDAVNTATVTIDLTDLNEIGEYKYGGVIFWVNAAGNEGLVCATTDQSTGIQWYNGSNGDAGANGFDIGTGQVNTTEIVNFQGSGSYAAQLCNDLSLNAFSDWFLPSEDELNQVFINRVIINSTSITNGGTAFDSSFYWTSSEFNIANAKNQNFSNGSQAITGKGILRHVRAVRAWSDF